MKKITIAVSVGIMILLFSMPVFAESLLFEKSEYAARRAKFMQEISDSIAINLGSASMPQHNDFTYLCGVDVPGAILIVDGKHKESILLYTTSERYLKGEGLSSLFEYTCKRMGSPELAFRTIISSAENHPYLHYSRYNPLLSDGDFLVVDGGPKLKGYCMDISISFPINGKLFPRQREIYEACLEVSKGCLAYYRPGATGYQIGEQVMTLLKNKGYDLSMDAFTRLRFFKEGGFTHYVGLSTHDAGGRDLDPGRVLKPGMVFACDVFAVFPGEDLGVRVENTVLITESGCELLNPDIPREIEEIEALMRKASFSSKIY